MSTILHLLRGQMSSPVNHLGGRCPHIPFFTGGQMSEGGNVRLPSFAAKRGEYIFNTQVMMTTFAAKRREISPRNAGKFCREISPFSRCFSEKLSVSRLLFSRFAEKNAFFKLR